MPVKLVVPEEEIDTIDEAIRPLYVQHEDGRYHLDTDGESIREHRDVLPLRNAYDRTKKELGEVKPKLTDLQKRVQSIPEDFDPEAWEKFKNGGGDDEAARRAREQQQAQMVELRKSMEAERDQWKSKYEETVAQVHRVTVERSLADAIGSAGITNPAFAKAVRAMLADQVKLDGDNPVVDTDMGPLPLGDYVKRWAASDDGKAFVSPPAGGGARGNERGSSGGKTVSAKELDSMTPQQKAKFYADNPGVTVTD